MNDDRRVTRDNNNNSNSNKNLNRFFFFRDLTLSHLIGADSVGRNNKTLFFFSPIFGKKDVVVVVPVG